MEKTMVKRGIGAIVLAIICALLLGYLLKGQKEAREEIVDLKLPGTPEMNISSLNTDNNIIPDLTSSSTAIKNQFKETKEIVENNSLTNKISDSTATLKDKVNIGSDSNLMDDFSIRPSKNLGTKEIVDINQQAEPEITKPVIKTEKVIASAPATPVQKTYKPQIIPNKPKPKKVVKKVTKAPVKTEDSTKSGNYIIQLLATSSELRARKMEQTMKKEGYNAFVTQTVKEGRVLFRVRIGEFNNRAAAKDKQDHLKRRYKQNQHIQNSLVTTN